MNFGGGARRDEGQAIPEAIVGHVYRGQRRSILHRLVLGSA